MRDYRETRRGPYIIKAAEKDSLATAGYAADLLDEVTKRLTAKYRFNPQTPILVEMFPNHADFEVRVLGLTGLGALGVCFGQVVALDSPSARKTGEFNWGSTLWHEYTHVITLQMTNNLIPRWFSEGLSVYEERHARPGWGDDWSLTNIKAYRDGRWLKISELDGGFLRPKSPDQVPLSYFQASQVCEFIADKYGFDAILEMLRRYRERERTPDILEKVLKLSQPDFDRAFDEYIKAKVGPYVAAIPAASSGTERPEKCPKRRLSAGWQHTRRISRFTFEALPCSRLPVTTLRLSSTTSARLSSFPITQATVTAMRGWLLSTKNWVISLLRHRHWTRWSSAMKPMSQH